jgi:hypothetical protein
MDRAHETGGEFAGFARMPRYFFQIPSESGDANDEGLDLPDLASAHLHALAALGAVITEELAKEKATVSLSVNITDDAGQRVARLKVETQVVSSEAPFED